MDIMYNIIMDTLVQADIFFFITTLAIVVVTIAILVALFFLIQILRDIRYVSRRVREQSDRVLSDVEELRAFLKREGKRALDIKDLIGGVLQVFRGKKQARKTASQKEA